MHRVHKRARSSRVVAQISLRSQRWAAGTQCVLEIAPGAVQLIAVADGITHERGASRHEERCRSGGIFEAPILFPEQIERDARAKERKKYGMAGARKRFQFSKR